LGALIPTAPGAGEAPPSGPSPVDVLIPGRTPPSSAQDDAGAATETAAAPPADAEGTRPTPTPAPVAGAHFAELPLDAITPNPRQPREVFEEEALAELVHSLREVGLLQPIVVRPLGDDRYELIMGERRWRAARAAGYTAIPAIVRSTGDDNMLRDALLENLHRSQLNPLEEAAAYDQLLKDFGCTHDELAGRIGRSRPQISNTLRLLKLPPLVQRRVAAGVLSAGHARALLGLDDGAAQERLAQRIVAEGLSVRSVEEIVALGGEPSATPRAPRGPKPVAPKLRALADRLSDRFETRVKVDLGRSKGRIVVEFASIDDLERIVALMAPDGDASGS
jgi:ParB family chromosome partitioning protein